MERRAPYTVCSTLTQNIVMQPISSGCTLHKIKYSVLSKKSCVCLFFIRAERPTDYKRNTLNLSISFFENVSWKPQQVFSTKPFCISKQIFPPYQRSVFFRRNWVIGSRGWHGSMFYLCRNRWCVRQPNKWPLAKSRQGRASFMWHHN